MKTKAHAADRNTILSAASALTMGVRFQGLYFQEKIK